MRNKEFTSLINCTKHGPERLIERGFTPKEALSVIMEPNIIKVQADGAKVFIQKLQEKYSVIILNENTGEVVTALKETTLKKLSKLGANHGWEINA